jgi:hypothetical protein
MTSRLSLLLLLLLACLVLPVRAQVPADASGQARARAVVARMIEAHGGMARWKAAPSIRYNNTFFNPFAAQQGENPWWYAQEQIEQGRRRVVQEWTLDEARLVYDGQETWTTNWQMGNPPRFMVHFFYYFLNLPWLTQDANVRLGEPGEGRLPGFDKTYLTVRMTFVEEPTVGKTALDAFNLYIDPDTYRLQGYEYTLGYGPMLDAYDLPPGQLLGPILRIHDTFTRVEGLLMPARFHTTSLDGSTTYGYHIITNYRFDQPFDPSRLQKPADAVIDTSTSKRKGTQ